MLSVTKRIETVQQPKGGYLPTSLFSRYEYEDDYDIEDILPAYKSAQGLVVDYMARFLMGFSKEEAFRISLSGAGKVHRLREAERLLRKINTVDMESVVAAYKLVKYDVYARTGTEYNPELVKGEIPEDIIWNTIKLIKRTCVFFKRSGPVIKIGFTFEGGYTSLVSSGDGDYLTKETLWDLKVSKSQMNTQNTLQILMYYILGVHSVHKEFSRIKNIAIYNPILNKAYILNVEKIPDEIFQMVSYKVLGYSKSSYSNDWRKADPKNFIAVLEFLEPMRRNRFDPDKYEDGVHDISLTDYWSYNIGKTAMKYPKFDDAKSIKLLKKGKYKMFVLEEIDGKYKLLYGARRHVLKYELTYYYQNMELYGEFIMQYFKKYWDFLYEVSEAVQEIDEKEFDGKVHGCIVDLDWYNHLYINPYDGKIVPYFAETMYEKHVYKNIRNLLKDHKPNTLLEYKRHLKTSNTLANIEKRSQQRCLVDTLGNTSLEKDMEIEYGIDMYTISKKLKQLQYIYDYSWITRWYEGIVLPQPQLRVKNTSPIQNRGSILGRVAIMECGMRATVIEDNGSNDITVRFDDGMIVEHVTRGQFRKEIIKNPNIKKSRSIAIAAVEGYEWEKCEKVEKRKAPSYKGRVNLMKCGMEAEVIEDFGSNNITVRFEDGLVKEHCTRARFSAGKISHDK
jgi:hypothetical protein